MTYSERVAELDSIFSHQPAIPDLGQIKPTALTRLRWGVSNGLVERFRAPWPGPLVGTCMKTWYRLVTHAEK